jgi:hypothetical protein
MMPTINGLTSTQVALLDEMWACDSFEEYEAFLECLDPTDRKEAMRLQQLLLVEMLDEEMARQDEYPEANMVIDQFRLTK